jgi:hypothetical protein
VIAAVLPATLRDVREERLQQVVGQRKARTRLCPLPRLPLFQRLPLLAIDDPRVTSTSGRVS